MEAGKFTIRVAHPAEARMAQLELKRKQLSAKTHVPRVLYLLDTTEGTKPFL